MATTLHDALVHLVTGPRAGGWPAVRDAALAAIGAGVRVVQYRDKELPASGMVGQARELAALCHARGAALIVNDRLDVALACGADGVHLGEDDLPWDAARRIAPSPFVIGCSAATAETVRAALDAGADYVGVGPAYVTGSKPDAGAPLPLARFADLAALCGGRVPVIAIGGIAVGGAAPLVRAGADGVAVISAVMNAADPALAAATLLREVADARAGRTR